MRKGTIYSGKLENCVSDNDAKSKAKNKRDEVIRLEVENGIDRLELLDRERAKIIKEQNNITISEAFDLSLLKPRKRQPSEHKIKTKRGAWSDFVAFLTARYPEIHYLNEVTSKEAGEYVSLFRKQGRFVQEVAYSYKVKSRKASWTEKTITRKTAGKPSPATSNFYQNTLKEVFTLLAEDSLIRKNPFDGIEKMKKDNQTRDIFTEEEISLIMGNLTQFVEPLFIVALDTALREGDICTLRWRDISLKDGIIKRQMNKTGVRIEIPMTDRLLVYLERQYERTGKGEYVFPEHATAYLKDRSAISYRVKSFLEGLGIETTYTPKGRSRAISVKDLHSCRHQFCSTAGKLGIPLPIVQSIVGHMTSAMTSHYMAHATLADKRKAIAVMPDYIDVEAVEVKAEPTAKERLIQHIQTLSEDEAEKILLAINGKKLLS